MKRKAWIPLSLIIVIFLACGDHADSGSSGLTLLPQDEMFELMRNRQMPPLDAIELKEEHGRLITPDSLQTLLSSGKFTVDFYQNQEGEIVNGKVRRITEEDKKLRRKSRSMREGPDIRILFVECDQQKELLDLVLEREKKIRKNGYIVDFNAQRDNIETVISIIEQCGMPTLEVVDSIHMSAIWQVFRNDLGQKRRKQYFKHLKKAADRGDLNAGDVAGLEDQILVGDGQPQRFGTYVFQDRETGLWKLYELEAPESVDARRREVGLGPIGEYLVQWEIPFEVTQIE